MIKILKLNTMKTQFNRYILFAFLSLFLCLACQDENSEVDTPEEQEIIQPNSPLASFIANVTANYGAYDNILDDSDCFSVELPVTLVVQGVAVYIETLDDIEALEDFIDELEDEDDVFDFVFPITIIFSDYTEIIIENIEQLEEFINDCDIDEGNDDIIECVDFVYPISFSVFNSEFNIIDTITVQNDEALYNLLDDLEDDENAVIVSLNYPVTLAYANGETISVNSNEELANAIETAEDDCEEEELCDIEIEELEALLLECAFEVEIENQAEELVDTLQFNFNQSGEIIVAGVPTVVDTGSWQLIETEIGIKLVIEGLQTFTIANGMWLLEECDDDDELEFIQETEEGALIMELELDCENDDDLFDCFDDFELLECADESGEATFNLSADTVGLVNCTESFTASFHHTLADAENDLGAISNTESFFSIPGEVYLRIEADSGNFEIFTVYLNTEDCDYFECFGDYNLTACDDNDGAQDGYAEFDLESIFSNCPNDDVEYYFYTSIANAEAEVDALTSPFTSSIASTIYSRVALAGDNSVYEIFTHQLIVEDCNNFECFESIDAELELCDDNGDGMEVFDLTVVFANCSPSADSVTYYETLQDANDQVNPIASPEAYTNIMSPEQTLYVRVEIGNEFQVFTLEIEVENCSSTCSEEDVDAYLLDCIWNALNYNGSDNLIQWDFDFESGNDIVVIYTDTDTIDATWETSQTENGVVVSFSNVNGQNIQAITGDWLVVECEDDRLELHREDDILVLERTCE